MLLLRLVAASEREAWCARRLVNEGDSLVHGGTRMDERGSLLCETGLSLWSTLWSRLDLLLRSQSHGCRDPGRLSTHGICLLKFEKLAYKDTSSLIV